MSRLAQRKTLLGMIVVAIMCVALLSFAAPAEAHARQGWNRDSKGNWYEYDSNGHYYKNGWQKIDREWYYFQSNGYTKSGWIKSGKDWYYLCMPHYAPNNGPRMTHGAAEYDGKNWYYFDTSGRMVTGARWIQYSFGWIYLGDSGVVASNCWKKLGGKWYYFGCDGYRNTNYETLSFAGIRTINGKNYYFDASSAMATGWQKAQGNWYYVNSSGLVQTGWQKISGKWYYFRENFTMATGWQKVGGKWYYLASNGVMQHDKWIGDYYLLSNGVMATSQWVDNGKYYVDENGKWAKGKVKTQGAQSITTPLTV